MTGRITSVSDFSSRGGSRKPQVSQAPLSLKILKRDLKMPQNTS